jgi:GT2 family glycosyltransferase
MPPSDPTVDVIVPVYNQCKLTLNCLSSVLGARNKTPFEVIVIDDASTDIELQNGLARLAKDNKITLLRNRENLGFTRSVNRGMRLHRDRDVILLNNDTLVFGDWIDRLHGAAYSAPRIASVNPLTNSSHISSYPFHGIPYNSDFEVTDAMLDSLASEVNADRVVVVHTTVGFCMYIQRAALDDLGLFDEYYFPYAYGEESDFCYRARKVGWKNLVAGNVFVRHFEGQSFGERRARLVAEALKVFKNLHPEYDALDRNFAKTDPNRQLRTNLHFGRLKLLLGGVTELPCCTDKELESRILTGPVLRFSVPDRTVQIANIALDTLPLLPIHVLPRDIASFNAMLKRLGVTRLCFMSDSVLASFKAMMRGRPMELGLAAEIAMTDGQAFNSS